MTAPGPPEPELPEPELREPDLPRTAKVRPRALRSLYFAPSSPSRLIALCTWSPPSTRAHFCVRKKSGRLTAASHGKPLSPMSASLSGRPISRNTLVSG